jgi:hypothetical protein
MADVRIISLHHAWITEGDKWPVVGTELVTPVHVASRKEGVGLDVYWLQEIPVD